MCIVASTPWTHIYAHQVLLFDIYVGFMNRLSAFPVVQAHSQKMAFSTSDSIERPDDKLHTRYLDADAEKQPTVESNNPNQPAPKTLGSGVRTTC